MSWASTQHVEKIVSGGQTGVDRGALDAAIDLGVEHGGWCPRGRLSEDGRIPDHYKLKETRSKRYSVRTEQNVIDSDATLILFRGRMQGGTELTYRLTAKHKKPALKVDLAEKYDIGEIRLWLTDNAVEVLNVAGPRDSSSPEIAAQAKAFIRKLLA